MVALRQNLQIRTRQNQSLTMTPQLQQAIRLLQLSTIDLRQEIQQKLEVNPMLEVDDSNVIANMESLDALAEKENQDDVFDPFSDDENGGDMVASARLHDKDGNVLDTSEVLGKDSEMRQQNDIDVNRLQGDMGGSTDITSSSFDVNYDPNNDDSLAIGAEPEHNTSYADDDGYDDPQSLPESSITDITKTRDRELEEDEMPDRLTTSEQDPGLSNQEDSFDLHDDNYSAKSRAKGVAIDDDGVYEGETQVNLHDHLKWQLDCSPMSERDYNIGLAIIDAISDTGYLSEPLEIILDIVCQRFPETTMDDVHVILKLVQSFDPLGVGARDVRECLMIQIADRRTKDNSFECALAEQILDRYMDMLSNHDYRNLCNKLQITEDTLKSVLSIIMSLTPRPGRTAVEEKSRYIVPDVIATKDKNGEYQVTLNPASLPRIKVNDQYKSLMCYAKNEREKDYFKSNLQEANWFIQSIAKRNDTLLKVARCIVAHQKAFLDGGECFMQPLVLNDIAQEVDMHESTISRVTTEKYIHTSRGTYELKYFFSSHVNTDDGGTASSTAIRAEIRSIVMGEDPRHPLSDNQIAAQLKDKGYCVARRTIAKYREYLNIGSSSQRKRLV